jgi:hypothetical protein
MVSYDPNTETMTWQTHNISRTNDFILQGVAAGGIGARKWQQDQWAEVMKLVYKSISKDYHQQWGTVPVISATALIREYDYNDYTNKIGK